MSVLVTGGAGYIGSHMVLALARRRRRGRRSRQSFDRLSLGVPPEATLIVGRHRRRSLVDRVIGEHGVDAIIHFAGSIVVPDSVADPLGYYLNNTVKSRGPDRGAGQGRREALHLLLDRRRLRHAAATRRSPKTRRSRPMSPYGRSKLMTEIDAAPTPARRTICATSRCAISMSPGADPQGRTGQSTPRATHLIKVACETALGKRDRHAGLRHRLPDARRHLRARLHPCQRPRRAPIRRRCAICAPAAPATSSTAAMAAAIRCSR